MKSALSPKLLSKTWMNPGTNNNSTTAVQISPNLLPNRPRSQFEGVAVPFSKPHESASRSVTDSQTITCRSELVPLHKLDMPWYHRAHKSRGRARNSSWISACSPPHMQQCPYVSSKPGTKPSFQKYFVPAIVLRMQQQIWTFTTILQYFTFLPLKTHRFKVSLSREGQTMPG